MAEERIVEVVNEALAAAGIQDTVTAAGEFEPRGHAGAGFAGGLIGGDLGDAIGSPAGGIGAVGGYLAGTQAHDAATGLPERMVVGVSETAVYGFAGNRAHPRALVFRVPREGLEAKLHQRVNVRVLELIDTESGSRIELEGMRLPITRPRDPRRSGGAAVVARPDAAPAVELAHLPVPRRPGPPGAPTGRRSTRLGRRRAGARRRPPAPAPATPDGRRR